ncbi:MAG TPA: tRNA-guanine transglycosylase, partial [Candidatus Poseidoniales archaeon]
MTERDGWARLGKLHTSTHVLNTPCLLPVINPNIRTVEPRELWERYGFEALITNSYVIWKHDKLKSKALEDGVHALLDYPGVIMTDSGTFQNYVYGDVEVGIEEIVTFQREIGVDIATMLDVFGTPDMTKEEVAEAVRETISRAGVSIDAAEGTLLNGPIQGGIHADLRSQSAIGMAE